KRRVDVAPAPPVVIVHGKCSLLSLFFGERRQERAGSSQDGGGRDTGGSGGIQLGHQAAVGGEASIGLSGLLLVGYAVRLEKLRTLAQRIRQGWLGRCRLHGHGCTPREASASGDESSTRTLAAPVLRPVAAAGAPGACRSGWRWSAPHSRVRTRPRSK